MSMRVLRVYTQQNSDLGDDKTIINPNLQLLLSIDAARKNIAGHQLLHLCLPILQISGGP